MRSLFVVLVIIGLGFLGYEYVYGGPVNAGRNARQNAAANAGEPELLNDLSSSPLQDERASILLGNQDSEGPGGEFAWKRAVHTRDYSQVELSAGQRDVLNVGSAARYALEVGFGLQEGFDNDKEISVAADAYRSQTTDEASEKSALLAAAFALLVDRGQLEAALAALGAGNEFLDGKMAKGGITAFIAQLGTRKIEDEEASLLLSRLLDRMTMGGPVWGEEHFHMLEQVVRVQQEVLGRVFFNSAGSWRSRHYEVKSGDNLETISNRFARELRIPLARGFLAKINGIPNPDLLRQGTVLRIPTDAISGVVELASHSIKIWVGDLLIRVYQVGLGRPDTPTRVGVFTILEKQLNPAWYPPGGGSPVQAGDSKNPLGRYFIKFAHEIHKGYGLHGTKDQASVGKNKSLGCVRLRGEDMDDLFQILPRGAKIRIR